MNRIGIWYRGGILWGILIVVSIATLIASPLTVRAEYSPAQDVNYTSLESRSHGVHSQLGAPVNDSIETLIVTGGYHLTKQFLPLLISIVIASWISRQFWMWYTR